VLSFGQYQGLDRPPRFDWLTVIGPLGVQGFASLAVGAGVPGYPCPPFKIIILDEAVSAAAPIASYSSIHPHTPQLTSHTLVHL
jgi:hypothetical protein